MLSGFWGVDGLVGSRMIETQALTKRFGSTVAVDRVDLALGPTGVFGLLGPNGAGKTTLIRLLTGFLSADEGEIRIGGIDLYEDPLQAKSKIGYLPETPPLYPELTVGEYLHFTADLRALPHPRRSVGSALERTGLVGHEKRLISSLSKGMRQRVGLCQAILHNPSILLLDEPTSGLDPVQLREFRSLIQELAGDRLVLWSTHVLSELEDRSCTLVFFQHGRILAQGVRATIAEKVNEVDHLWMRVAATPPGFEAHLAANANIRKIVPVENGWKLWLDEQHVGAVSESIRAFGAQIVELTWRRASLEELFHRILVTK